MQKFCFLAVIIAAVCFISSPATAERFTAAPISGETITLFGQLYSVSSVAILGTAWPGTGDPTGWDCGVGVGFAQGADVTQDRIFLADECGGGGEDILLFTGVEPYTFEPSTTATTAAYIVDDPGGHGQDPCGIDWISDVDTGAGVDINIRYARGTSGSVVGQDLDGIPYPDSENGTVVDNYNVQNNGGSWSGTSWGKPWGACKNGRGDAASRWYVGYVNEESAVRYFAYDAFDLPANAWVQNWGVHLTALGTPDENRGWEQGRDLRGLAFDGTYYYVMYRPPSVDECWLARYTSFPDPVAGSNLVHSEAPLTVRLDDPTGGISFDSAINRPDRAGIACGRLVWVGSQRYPVFYVLADRWLYTLRPVQESIVNGDFTSSLSPWIEWTERGTLGASAATDANCPTSGGDGTCLLYNSTGVNGGLYQAMNNMVNGGVYNFTVWARDFNTGANNGWAEPQVGSSAPVNGSDYGPIPNGICKWDTFACDNFDSGNTTACVKAASTFTATATTMYFVLKFGVGGGTGGVSWDDVSVTGALGTDGWMMY